MGIVTPGDFAQAGRVLDLGMGKGSVGGIMRQLNPDCQLVGGVLHHVIM